MAVPLDGKEVPAVHYTRHAAEEPSGLTQDIDIYEPETDIMVLDNEAPSTSGN